MPSISRIGPSRYSPTRSRLVAYNGVATTVATASVKSASLYEQARDTLVNIDRQLEEIGTNKSKVLTAMVYITDINNKSEFNRAWDEWVDKSNLPLRACIGASLEAQDLVEIVVTAAVEN